MKKKISTKPQLEAKPVFKDELVKLTIAIEYDPEAIGPERQQRIWEGVAVIIDGMSDDQLKSELLEQMKQHRGGHFSFRSVKGTKE